jgi:hypothetical protein
LVRKSELLYNEISVADSTDGATFSFTGEITPLSTIAIAIKNTDATTRTVTFEGLDRNGVYTSLYCINAVSGAQATQTAATTSEVWTANVSAFTGIRVKATALADGTLSLTATLIS